MKKVLITGGSGFIGRNLVKHFAGMSDMYEVMAPVREELDLTDMNQTTNFLVDFEPDYLLHCAAILPSKCDLTDDDLFKINHLIDFNILEGVKLLSACRLIYASGTSVYKIDTGKIDEYSTIGNSHPYIQAKIDGERMFQSEYSETTILRISAPFGSGQSTNTVLQLFCASALKQNQIKLFGRGRRIQYFTYIQDVVDAFELSILNPVNGIFNICPDSCVSMQDLAKTIVTITKSKSKLVYTNQKDIELEYKIDNSKAKEELHWTPKTSLESGLQKVIDGYRNFL